MAVLSGSVSVAGSGQTLIVPAVTTTDGSAVSSLPPRNVFINVTSGNPVVIGSSSVTTSTGIILQTTDPQFAILLPANEAIYGVGSGGSATVEYLITNG